MNKMKRVFTIIFLAVFLLAYQSLLAQTHVVVHTVEEGQTLYAISKLYNVTPDDIQRQNPLVDESFTIKPGQMLRIILKDEKQVSGMMETLKREPKMHKVKPKETLYGISKDYDISMDELKSWNEIDNNRISIDQNLIVGWRYVNKSTSKPVTPSVILNPQPEPTQPRTEPAPQRPTRPSDAGITITDKQNLLQERFNTESSGKSVMSTNGPAIWFNTDNRMLSARYYALFSEAPVGSVVKVRNPVNSRVIYAKVIGGLPDTAENHGAMIKLTEAAKQQLQSPDAKLRVEVSYVR